MKINRLKFEQLVVRREGQAPLFDQVDFEFPMDGVYWIRGETGSGKSTLLKLLAGLREPTEGRYFINKTDITEMSFEEWAPFRRRIGYGFDHGGLISNRTIRQNLMLPFFYHQDLSAEEAENRVNEYIERFRLQSQQNLRPAQVSSGARKACCVARSLILEPELLLLDSPSSGLEDREARTLVDLIRFQRQSSGLRHVFFVGESDEIARHFDCGVIRICAGRLSLEKAA